MSDTITVYGTKITLPVCDTNSDILYANSERKLQKWTKQQLPHYFEKVEYDSTGNLILSTQQEIYATKEVERCKKGVWANIGGINRYITGRYYFFLQYYVLEDGNPPEFREADRLYFLFFEHWFNIDWCLGIIRTKKRRQGASSQSCSNILYESIFYRNSNCGVVSKTKEDSKATFTEMITYAYRQLPVFLKPKQVNKEDSVTELLFAHKVSSGSEKYVNTIKQEDGHNSKINYKAPVLNAYDRGRMSYILGDEFAKLSSDVPASRMFAIMSKTLVKGVKRVGWIDMPSTVNEMTKEGGAEFKKIWDSANQFDRKPTINRVVRMFQPAYEAYEGFIDEYGDSVIDTPTKEQYEYLVSKWVQYTDDGEQKSELNEEDIKLGAKEYVKIKRRIGLKGVDLEEEIRMNPCDEEEAFLYAGIECEFNSINIQHRIKYLEDNPIFLRRCRLVMNKSVIKATIPHQKDLVKEFVTFIDDEKGGWLLSEKPIKENNFIKSGDFIEAQGKHLYQIGVDTTKNEFALNGSKPTILVMKQSLIIEGVEMGMKPVAIYDDKTRLGVHFDEEVLKACLWYGCTANYEGDARTDFYRYFWNKNATSLLEWTPKIAQNPAKKKPLTPFTLSGDPFQLYQQLQVAKMYIDGTSQEDYNGHVQRIEFPDLLKQLLKYNHSERTPYDQVIALMMSLLPIVGRTEVAASESYSRPKKILPTYKIA